MINLTKQKNESLKRFLMRKLLWLIVPLILVVLAFTAAVICKWPEMTEQDKQALAAWTQAIGSIVALIIAIGVPAWQHNKAEKFRQIEANTESWKILRLIWLLTSSAEMRAQSIGETRSKEGGTETPAMRVRQLEGMQEIYDALEAIPLASVPTLEAIQYFMKVKRLVRNALKEIRRCPYPDANMGSNELYGKPWIRLFNELKEASALFAWQAAQHRDGALQSSEPSFLND
jgi:uncharacterized membrane protein